MMTTRTAQLRVLGPALVRAVRWQPAPVAALGALLLLWWQDGGMADPNRSVWVMRSVALLLALGAAFALDDRTRSTLAAVPTPLWWRTAVRLAVLAVPVSLAWGGALAWAQWRTGGALPAGALTLEAGALTAVVLAAAGGLARWRALTDPGIVAGPVVMGLGLLLPQLPDRVALAVAPGPGWDAAHARWSVLLAVAVAVLALSLRDPAAPRRRLVG